MPITRKNHYVPEWYQKGFWEAGRSTLAYLNLMPETFTRSDGSKGHKRALHDAPPARAFVQWDLYSTFFGTLVNDEIERQLFGDIDTRGAKAVRAFADGDPRECHENFESLFEYIDIQKLRTPKGLAWLKAQYPSLSQNELMMELQAIRMMHWTIWTEGVREIVSALDSDVKFIISDHPVTVYNPLMSPKSKACKHPNDPGIELKGTQTLFPLDRNHCLILTNLEFAEDPTSDPIQKRTFARRFRNSMVRTDAFVRSRQLTAEQVTKINQIIRSRAHNFVAAGEKDWLPEPVQRPREWKELGTVLRPSSEEMFHFGGEMFVRYESGDVRYQDAYGRTEKEREFLKKAPVTGKPRSGSQCGCGSNKTYAECCGPKPVHLRPAWDELGIRERNLALFRGIENVLELRPEQDWSDVRRAMTDDKISKIYSLYEALWPLDTDLLKLLPKPDGTPRAVYTGMLDPMKIAKTGLGSSLIFGELLVQHPFVNPRTVNEEFNPVKNPAAYRLEVLKSVLFFMQVMPLVETGLVNLFPDPWDFDYHLRDQTMHLAEERWNVLRPMMDNDEGMKTLAEEEVKRSLFLLSEENQRAMIKRTSPELSDREVSEMIKELERLKEEDPYAVLQEGAALEGVDGGQFSMFKLAPNFEMSMYVAQATGAAIVTDHPIRWKEILFTIIARGGHPVHHLNDLALEIGNSQFPLLQRYDEILEWWLEGCSQRHANVLGDVFKYLRGIDVKGEKPNYERHLLAEFKKAHLQYESIIEKANPAVRKARVKCVFPSGGIYDSTISRLLLMSSSEYHLQSVPMAFYMEN
ncbi:DUF4238 domain-containing protein [Sulfitobacter mediterraneus]|uniref:DUF4238 domain-containing protein n=1 Tax=Sulfitobacter mediterraneus TaxID=83219 RepID=UPI001932A105|nr:DUF4238 domain-containing protein [Sulfitobacter mediterraneus]MBM1310354.1 DUF4238 domain-containing protein [Sulfitobacter mediterraneus]MBM1314238.1 DUF4238 domain-containing protein [Sulfitobacter mediterraneus]MBM1322598.1 DUF4238 domain-containing protein [Sulfitobacter mediterraneus]MBM1326510.1 DUF4238 domain-containing protein [Sulfitobacter mediterraneus]MBM1397856.1 DUF4238 domain-containing protein [Sulfitobacter mediterraneus]